MSHLKTLINNSRRRKLTSRMRRTKHYFNDSTNTLLERQLMAFLIHVDGVTSFRVKHQLRIDVETMLIVSFYQRCFKFDIWLKIKVDSTHVY